MDLTSKGARKTYWHLSEAKRVPSRYEVVTSKLLYYPEKGFSVRTPVVGWYERYLLASPIPVSAYAKFSDPNRTTYRTYVRAQRDKEIGQQSMYDIAVALGEDEALSAAWRESLLRVLSVLPFMYNGLHMQSAYCGQLAPQSELVVVFGFKAADALRCIQSIGHRLSVLEPGLDWVSAGRAAWQDDAAWQPLRELIERMLVAYDFGEAWVAATLVVAPVLDWLFLREFARLAHARSDGVSARVLQSLATDAAWHRSWSGTLALGAVSTGAQVVETMTRWIRHWWPLTERAVTSALELWDVPASERQRIVSEMVTERKAYFQTLGVQLEAT